MRTLLKMLALRTARNRDELKKAHKTLKEDLAIAFPEILDYAVTSKEVLIFLSTFGCLPWQRSMTSIVFQAPRAWSPS
ncbi:MAG: hypothetical protein RBR15_14930 [Sphaerochaeta sp.]|nr:hypothetical protein [Sphaerochaeta sp.]